MLRAPGSQDRGGDRGGDGLGEHPLHGVGDDKTVGPGVGYQQIAACADGKGEGAE